MVICENILQTDSELMQIVDALDLLRSFFGLRKCREQKRGENCDDGNYDEKFNQRERGTFILAAAGHAQAILHFAFSFNGQHLSCGHGAFAKGD
jgi:hypothetical protein